MHTQEIFDLALNLSHLEKVPGDSGVLVPGENIKKVAIGIDIDTADLLLARELGVDCVITHHPQGANKINLYQVMDNQINHMVKAGVPINRAEKALTNRQKEVERGSHPTNYDRVARSAELLKMPFIGIHSPADLLGEKFLQNYLDENLKNKPQSTLQDVIDIINELPEYKNATTRPIIPVGSEKSYAGKVWVAMAGGTNGGAEVFKAYFAAGIGTLVVMHIPENVIKAVKKQNIGNVIVAGHMASDSLGLNIFIKELEKRGIEIIRLAGVIEPC